MGVRENLRWLRDNQDRAGVFVAVARHGPCKMRELQEHMKSDDWWPVKSYVADLTDRDIVAETDGMYRLTETGEKVFESLRTVYDLEGV